MNTCDFKEDANDVLNSNKTLRYIASALTVLLFITITYATMLLLPATSLWFEPMKVVVEDTTEGVGPPAMGYERNILQDVDMEYTVTVRRLPGLVIQCNAKSGIFRYKRSAELPNGDNLDLKWWVDGRESRCWELPHGSYIMTTCWTIPRPFWGLVPAKTTCIDSNTFTIMKPEE